MHKFFKSELGRSMVEMLGVLALVGVLSIAAVAGYSYAITKWKANETLSEIGQRAMEESLFLMKPSTNPVLGMALPETDFGPTSSLGYAVSAFISDVNEDYFEIVLQNIPSNVCAQLVRDDEISIGIFVGETAVNGDPSFCGEEETTPEMSFVFRADLSRFNNCSQKGYFDLTDLSCHCSGNTYIDSDTNECLCPAGHVWSENEKTCIESICDEGEFESFESGCVPCSHPTAKISNTERIKQLCMACGNRTITEQNKTYYCVNTDIQKCIPGTSLRVSVGYCVSCAPSSGTIHLGADTGYGDTRSLCNACPDRHLSGNHCIDETACESGETFRTSSGTCKTCDDPTSIEIGTHESEQALCRACGNRSVDGKYCKKTTCDSDEFKGADGLCYDCTNPKSIKIGTDAALKTLCEATACGREIVEGFCRIKNCKTDDGSHVRTANGACYDCAQTAPFDASQTECDSCTPTRKRTGYYETCMLTSLCQEGVSYPYSDGKWCGSCSTDGLPTGNSVWSQYMCEKCGNIWLDGKCYRKDSCTPGTQFHTTTFQDYKQCVSCDLVESRPIGDHDVYRTLCQQCSTEPRFFADNRCYRCNTDETPDVTTDAEKSSCTLCTERTLSADGKKCILKQ